MASPFSERVKSEFKRVGYFWIGDRKLIKGLLLLFVRSLNNIYSIFFVCGLIQKYT
jgi:hypothetical protein